MRDLLVYFTLLFSVKVINKEMMKGREYLILNEINILKSVSKGHPNVVTLHDCTLTLTTDHYYMIHCRL